MNQKKLRELVISIMNEVEDEDDIEESTATGNVSGYNVPHAFGKQEDEKKKTKRLAATTGYIPVNENKTKFDDLKIGDKFLRFGKNGQLWKKTSKSQAQFIKNVGNKTAKYHNKSGSLNSFPLTMDVTPITENLSEGTNRFHQLRKEEATPNQKIGKGIREIRKQIQEMEKFIEWYSKIKTENGLDSSQYWKRTQKHLNVIRERLNRVSQKIQNLSV